MLIRPGQRAAILSNGIILSPTRQAARVSSGSTSPGTTGLALWYNLNETSGFRFESFNGVVNLSSYGGVGWDVGLNGNAAYFAGANYLGISSTADLVCRAIDYTWTTWVKPAVASNGYVFAKRQSIGPILEYYILYHATSSRFAFANFIGSTTYGVYSDSGPAISTGNWYFVAGWHDETTQKNYIQINNGAIDEVSLPGSTTGSGAFFAMGRRGGDPSGYFTGTVDTTNLYKRLLNADERTWLYNGGIARAFAEL